MTEDTNTDLTPDEDITSEDFEDPVTYEHKLELVSNGLKRPDMEREFVHHLILHNPFFDIINDFKSEYLYYSEYMELFDFAKKKIEQDEEVNLLTIREYYFKDFDPITAQEHYDAFTDRVNHASKKTIKHYAETLKELYYRRGTIDDLLGAVRDIRYKTELTTKEIINNLTEGFEEVLQIDDNNPDNTALDEIEQEIDNGVLMPASEAGISSGFKNIDRVIGGLEKERLITIGAATGFGKTSLAMNLAQKGMASIRENREEYVTLFFSTEMSSRELYKRLIATVREEPLSKIKNKTLTEEERISYKKTTEYIKSLNIRIISHGEMTLARIKQEYKKASRKQKVVAIFVDYMQNLAPPPGKANKVDEVSVISHGLKQIALNNKVPVVALAQFNRQSVTRDDKTPVMTDLKGSSSIEHDSDVLILMSLSEDSNSKKVSKVKLDVKKNRDGEEQVLSLVHRKDIFLFEEDIYSTT